MPARRAVVLVTVLLLAASGVYVQQTVFIDPPRVLGGSGQPNDPGERVSSEVSFRNHTVQVAERDGSPIVILSLSGPNDALRIDLRDVGVVWADSTGTDTLRPADDFDDPSSIDGPQFAYTVRADDNDSAPVMDSIFDRFGTVIRPETFTNASAGQNGPVSICLSEPQLRNLSVTWRVTTNESAGERATVTNTAYGQPCRDTSQPAL